ncbi:hypothetical protein M0R45_006417 [Rubus argutus]|uniref:Uncharacterized protein n=1 Tax=Rubus argutus TaxID=59490 RepID=A0AAW1YQS1_RUBAR
MRDYFRRRYVFQPPPSVSAGHHHDDDNKWLNLIERIPIPLSIPFKLKYSDLSSFNSNFDEKLVVLVVVLYFLIKNGEKLLTSLNIIISLCFRCFRSLEIAAANPNPSLASARTYKI